MIKRVLSVVTVVMASIFIITGIAVLLLQRSYIAYYNPQDIYYPLGAIVQLLFTGVPCLIFGAINLAYKDEDAGNRPLFVMIYCSVILIVHNALNGFLNVMQSIVAARTGGASYLAGLTAVTSAFAWTRIFANGALVFLLIVSVMQYMSRKY